MRHTVVWNPAALDDLARIWLTATDRLDVSRSSHEIERQLKYAPTTMGQPTVTGWALSVPPLAVAYTVSPADCLVEILRVWRVR
jgi:hypothetical protein